MPKDVRGLNFLSRTNNLKTPLLDSVLPSNEAQIKRAIDLVSSTVGKRLGVIGLSFKDGTDDLRESPLVTLVEKLIGKGLRLKIYDPEVRVANLIGANKRYIDEVIPHIGSLMCASVAEAMAGTTSVVVGLSGDDVAEDIYENTQENQDIIDLVSLAYPDRLKGNYRGVCW